MAEDAAGGYYPTNEDPFDPAGDMERLTKSIPGLIVPVVNRTAADEYVVDRTAEGRPPTDSDPAVVWRADIDTVERNNGSNWAALGAAPVYALLQRRADTGTISPGTPTTITVWPTKHLAGDVSESNGVITVNRSGIYLVSFSVPWDNAPDGNFAARVYKTGDSIPVIAEIKGRDGNLPNFCKGSLPLPFTAGDSIYLEVSQTSSSGVSIIGGEYPYVLSVVYQGA